MSKDISDIKIEIKEDHYLNEYQKQIQHKIMEELMNALNDNITQNLSVLDSKAITDILLSCVIMFTRDVLIHFFIFSGSTPIRGKIMNHVFEQIKKEVQERIKERMN